MAKPCCLKAVEFRPLGDFEKYVFLFIFLSPRFCSSIDLQVNASLCCSVKPLISYCYVSAATGEKKKKCIFKEIILGLQAKSRKGKTTKGISLESMINNIWPYLVLNWLVLQVFRMGDYLPWLVGLFYSNCVPLYWSGLCPWSWLHCNGSFNGKNLLEHC